MGLRKSKFLMAFWGIGNIGMTSFPKSNRLGLLGVLVTIYFVVSAYALADRMNIGVVGSTPPCKLLSSSSEEQLLLFMEGHNLRFSSLDEGKWTRAKKLGNGIWDMAINDRDNIFLAKAEGGRLEVIQLVPVKVVTHREWKLEGNVFVEALAEGEKKEYRDLALGIRKEGEKEFLYLQYVVIGPKGRITIKIKKSSTDNLDFVTVYYEPRQVQGTLYRGVTRFVPAWERAAFVTFSETSVRMLFPDSVTKQWTDRSLPAKEFSGKDEDALLQEKQCHAVVTEDGGLHIGVVSGKKDGAVSRCGLVSLPKPKSEVRVNALPAGEQIRFLSGFRNDVWIWTVVNETFKLVVRQAVAHGENGTYRLLPEKTEPDSEAGDADRLVSLANPTRAFKVPLIYQIGQKLFLDWISMKENISPEKEDGNGG